MNKTEINVYIWDKFDDYEVTEQTIFENYNDK